MMDLNKFTGTDKSHILHTSGHARVAQGDKMGSSSLQSFNDRLHILKKERTVADYRRSAIGSRYASQRARQATPDAARPQPVDGSDAPTSRQGFNASGGAAKPAPAPAPTRQFKEPPSRGYNPYA